MSICVSVKVGEGLVLAADSVSAIGGAVGEGAPGVLNTYEHATKICQVKDYPMAVASWGIGSVGARTVASLVAEFSNSAPSVKDKEAKGYTAKQLAAQVFGFVKEKYGEAFEGAPKGREDRPALGLLAAGYGTGEFFPEQYVALLPIDGELKPARRSEQPEFGANWYGLTDAILRLYKGFDPSLPDKLLEAGLGKEQVEKVLGGLEYPVAFDGMPLQDAIDFAVYLIGVVIGRFRFVLGAPVCGGQIDVAVITPGRFDWVQRKTWRARPVWHRLEGVSGLAQG